MLLVFLQAAPAEFSSPPKEVCPAGQRKHLQLAAFAPLTMKKGQLGAAVGSCRGPVPANTWLPQPGAHSAHQSRCSGSSVVVVCGGLPVQRARACKRASSGIPRLMSVHDNGSLGPIRCGAWST